MGRPAPKISFLLAILAPADLTNEAMDTLDKSIERKAAELDLTAELAFDLLKPEEQDVFARVGAGIAMPEGEGNPFVYRVSFKNPNELTEGAPTKFLAWLGELGVVKYAAGPLVEDDSAGQKYDGATTEGE